MNAKCTIIVNIMYSYIVISMLVVAGIEITNNEISFLDCLLAKEVLLPELGLLIVSFYFINITRKSINSNKIIVFRNLGALTLNGAFQIFFERLIAICLGNICGAIICFFVYERIIGYKGIILFAIIGAAWSAGIQFIGIVLALNRKLEDN